MNLAEKLTDETFFSDIDPLTAPDIDWDLTDAARYVQETLLPLLPGEPWRGGK